MSEEKYPESPHLVHLPNLVHARIIMAGNQPTYEKWVYQRTDFPCGMCGRSDDVVFMRTKPLNVVGRSCEYCGFTTIVVPIDPITGEEIARKVESRPISVSEAWEYLRKWGQQKFPPVGLPKAGQRKRRPIPEDLKFK